MKIEKIEVKKFKRFTNLKIDNIPSTVKLVLLVGPNGSGKTSLFEAFYLWYKLNGHNTIGSSGNESFYVKKEIQELILKNNWYSEMVNINFHGKQSYEKNEIRGKFYFRTAYRNESDFTIAQLNQQNDPTQKIRLETLMGNDITVSENYQRLVSQTLSNVYNKKNDEKNIKELRNELIGKIQTSLNKIFDDLNLSSIGEPLSNGSFFFEKGISKDFHYRNLSAGEKSAFDIILDLIIKSAYYSDAIYCIDEPEAHMHTRLQSKLLSEMYNLT